MWEGKRAGRFIRRASRAHRTARIALHLPEEVGKVVEIDLGGEGRVGGEVSERMIVGHGLPSPFPV